MLEKLVINNVALIQRAEIEFGEGLNVLSGETGSGKSVILDSINFVLGAKADRSMIRHGENECSVFALFRIGKDSAAYEAMDAIGIEPDEEIVISRKYRVDGRGDIRLNGSPLNAGMLRGITSHLVDVHGQSEHFYLLNEANQLALLDKAAGAPLKQIKEKLLAFLAGNREIRKKLKSLGGDDAERGRRLDILQYQMDEIDRAELSDGEEERLETKKLFFANVEKIMRGLSEAAGWLNGEGAAVDGLNGARRALSDISQLDPEYAALFDRLESVIAEAEDIGATLADLEEGLSFDEETAQNTEDRLDLIRSLKKKYGADIGAILAYRRAAGDEYELLTHCDEEFAALTAEQTKNFAEIYSLCRQLTGLRKKAADKFCGDVERELRTLNIPNAKFRAEFNDYTEEDAVRSGENGLDEMRFLFSANAGEPLKPLNKVISGGEMSRLMLAIKTCATDENGISTYIFDEIDAGISGATAKTVAEKFALIAKSKQIIAVSHLAQIAAMADENFLISKSERDGGKTLTDIFPLDEEGKTRELVRLLGGTQSSEAALSLADELKMSCEAYKKSVLN